jgi:probable F420-dependent oxidoreductase
MKFCLPLAFVSTDQWAPLARTAEAAGFEALILSDHLFYPNQLQTPYPYTPDGRPLWEPSTAWPDPLIAIGALSGVTEKLRFITAVYLLPLRHPVAAAKAIATAAVFARDRLTLGIGAGWMREEFEVVGSPFERRGARLEESLEVIKKLWAGGAVEHHGEFYDFDALEISPVPAERVPVWGGGTSDLALRRAGSRFDGWTSQIQTTAELHEFVPRLQAARRDSPLAEEPFDICAAVSDAFALEHYEGLGELGVTHMITVPWLLYGVREDDLKKRCDALKRFGDDVIALQ